MLADSIKTDRQTETLITILQSPTGGGVIFLTLSGGQLSTVVVFGGRCPGRVNVRSWRRSDGS